MVFYEQSPEERSILIEKAKRRAELRADYLKQLSNPHKHGDGGCVVCIQNNLKFCDVMSSM